MINQASNLSLSMSLSLPLSLSPIYHHQPTVIRSTHMDTKTITITCTSSMYKNLYHTMYINHLPEHVPYNVPKPIPYHIHQPCTVSRTSTMYQTCTISCINYEPYHVPRPPRSASNNVPYHHHLMNQNQYHNMCLNHIPYHS
jgi:hypothetical protein